MVLGASSYTYAEATLTQELGDFVGTTVLARVPGALERVAERRRKGWPGRTEYAVVLIEQLDGLSRNVP